MSLRLREELLAGLWYDYRAGDPGSEQGSSKNPELSLTMVSWRGLSYLNTQEEVSLGSCHYKFGQKPEWRELESKC